MFTKGDAVPVEYRIDIQNGLVLTTLSGTLSFDECQAHHRRLASDPDFKPDLSELMDGSAVNRIPISYASISKLADSCPFGIHARRAIVSSDNLLNYGVARMFQSFSSGKHGEIMVFKDKDEALSWLDLH